MNKLSQHTPGPWTARPTYSKGEPMPACVFAGRESIADMTGTSPHDDANARLIAAAPDLIMIAERLTVYIESAGLIPPCVREARKIIAQAKGGE